MNSKQSSRRRVLLLTQAAMIAALAYICFQFLSVKIPVGAGTLTLHLGNAMVVLGAMLLGGGWGGAAGALGLTLADLTSGYATSAPKTFLLKLIIGLLAGLIAHRLLHIETARPKKQFRIAFLTALVPLALNVVLDPVAGYFYKSYVLGIPQDLAAALAKIGSLSTLVNTVTGILFVCILWPAIYPALHRAELLVWQK